MVIEFSRRQSRTRRTPSRLPVGTRVPQRFRVAASIKEALGDELRSERVTQQRTLADVADAAGVSLPYLSEIERGSKDASSEVIESIARSLDVPVPDLLTRVADRMRGTGTGTTMLAA